MSIVHIHDKTTDHCCCTCTSGLKTLRLANTCIHGEDPQNCPDCNVR